MTGDLEANRRGDITASQRDALLASTRIPRGVAWPVLSVLGLIGLYVVLDWSPWLAAVVATIAGIAAAWLIGTVVSTSRRIARDLAAGVVAHDNGTVAWRRGHDTWRGGHYVATIEGTTPI